MSIAHASSRPETTIRLNGLDHLRALAITLVFLFHYGKLFPHPEWIESISKFGWTGVDLFFVLSGFLISSQLFSSIKKTGNFSYREFFIKRFFRIIPAYLVVVTLYFLFPLLREREGLAPLWRYLTFTQNFGLDLRYFGTFSHAWSLCIEEQFYFLLPMTLLLLLSIKRLRIGGWLLGLLFIGGFIIRLTIWNAQIEPVLDTELFGLTWYKWIYYPTFCRLDSLLVGVALAAIMHYGSGIKTVIERWGNWLLVAGLAVLSIAYVVCLEELSFTASIYGFPLVAVGYGLLVASAISPSCLLYKYSSRLTNGIATLSFGIYLIHKIIIHITQAKLEPIAEADTTIVFICSVMLSIIAALVLYKIVEAPMLHLRHTILRKEKPQYA